MSPDRAFSISVVRCTHGAAPFARLFKPEMRYLSWLVPLFSLCFNLSASYVDFISCMFLSCDYFPPSPPPPCLSRPRHLGHTWITVPPSSQCSLSCLPKTHSLLNQQSSLRGENSSFSLAITWNLAFLSIMNTEEQPEQISHTGGFVDKEITAVVPALHCGYRFLRTWFMLTRTLKCCHCYFAIWSANEEAQILL